LNNKEGKNVIHRDRRRVGRAEATVRMQKGKERERGDEERTIRE
jgi:hypothetical protein